MSKQQKAWLPPGPVSARFYAARDFLSIIMGPVGSAKTTTTLRKLMMLANVQAPSPADGVRRSRWRVVRDTYKNVKETTLVTWKKIVPTDHPSTVRFVQGGPADAAVHEVQWRHPMDGSKVLLEVEFVGLGELTAENAMSSWEGTGIYFNEFNLMDEQVFLQGITRVGRYPGDSHGLATAPCILADLNAPPVTCWTYGLISRIQSGKLDELLATTGIDTSRLLSDWHTRLAGFYRQPGGREAGAENLENLPPGYYDRQVGLFMLAGREDMITTKVDNQFGPTKAGKPVYIGWKDSVHVAPAPLSPLPERTIIVGADQGLVPAAALLQEDDDGQVIVLDELVCPRAATWTAEEFAEHLMRLRRSLKYRGFTFVGWHDPAGNARSSVSNEKASWAAIVRANTDFSWRPASSNDITSRLASVRAPLARQGGFLLSPTCEALREGFNSGYRFRRKAVAGEEYDEHPEKNWFSNVHDALQYGCMGLGLHYDAAARTRPGRISGPVQAKTSFSIFRR